ncbi:MAG: hypothetical protein ACXV5H_12385 [Halobacteriota archaeon]
MQFVAKTKIEQKRSKPTITYPLIRLPREFAKVIGSSASIYQTRYEDSPAFVVVLDDKEAGLLKEEVGQLSLEVGQPDDTKSLKARLYALETEISEIKSLLFLNEGCCLHKNGKYGPGVIRTHDLRHVKTEDSRHSGAFSLGEMTTRKASAPS